MEKNRKDKAAIVDRMILTPAELHVREAAEGEEQSRTITGYAILFNTLSAPMWEYRDEKAYEKIVPTAVTKELLDTCDIKMTMFHDRQLILARSNGGKGTLTYNVDEKGVSFEFEAPKTVDGDKALELVRRGDIAGCSFAFRTHYYDEAYVSRSVERKDGMTIITYEVKAITGIYDFTLAADPAYPDTEVGTRELIKNLRAVGPGPAEEEKKMREQVAEMRRTASDLYKF